jgi:orotate phosphoribosyltransferase
MSKERVADILLDICAVTLSPQKPFTYASGLLGPIYTDCRLLISHVDEREEIVNEYKEVLTKIGMENVDYIAGVASSGIPFASWVADVTKKRMVYVNKEVKTHGRQKQIEGELEKGSRGIVIEDLINQGESALNAIKAIKNEGAIPTHCIAILTYQMPESAKKFKEQGVELIALTDIETLIRRATERKNIDKEQEKMIREWTKDAIGWGRRMGFEEMRRSSSAEPVSKDRERSAC